jgi:diguanylate cyclase (GGDEF)-like protein
VAELDGFARFEGGFGAGASHRILAAVGEAMRRKARRTDRVAHVGGGRFLVLLPETDEIQAINYVERIRGECDRWLDAGAVALRLSVGWASPSAVGELDGALRTAEDRMYAERRRAARAGTRDPDATR